MTSKLSSDVMSDGMKELIEQKKENGEIQPNAVPPAFKLAVKSMSIEQLEIIKEDVESTEPENETDRLAQEVWLDIIETRKKEGGRTIF